MPATRPAVTGCNGCSDICALKNAFGDSLKSFLDLCGSAERAGELCSELHAPSPVVLPEVSDNVPAL